MRGIWLGVASAIAVEQSQKVRAIGLPVPVMSIRRLFDGDIGGHAGGGQRRKGACVQFIDQGIAQGVVVNQAHGGSSGIQVK